MLTAPQTSTALGYAGLVPFVAPAIAIALGVDHALLSPQVANVYAFGIIAFLCGSWWGKALGQDHRRALLLSNLLFLVGFFVFCFAIEWWPLTASLLLAGLFVIEFSGAVLPFASNAYRRMRLILTLAASASMLTVHFAR